MTERGAAAPPSSTLRTVAFSVVGVALLVVVWLQRTTISDAVTQLRRLSILTIVVLAILAFYERWSRADIVRRLLGDVSLGRAVTIHDVGNAASKGVPMGGAVGTALRWSIARDARVGTPEFATMLIAYGIATTFVSWLLPLSALSADLVGRTPTATDTVLGLVIIAVLVASASFWMVVTRSDRVEAWTAGRLSWVWARIAARVPAANGHDPTVTLRAVRADLHRIVRRPWWLLARTVGAQACGAIILLVALRGVGVGGELGLTEFFRVFFLTHLLGTFAPTPGGVGVVEAGMTGSLVAAGVDMQLALAAVLVYRFLTYVVPIVFGAALYLAWRAGRTLESVGTTADIELVDAPVRLAPVTTNPTH